MLSLICLLIEWYKRPRDLFTLCVNHTLSVHHLCFFRGLLADISERLVQMTKLNLLALWTQVLKRVVGRGRLTLQLSEGDSSSCDFLQATSCHFNFTHLSHTSDWFDLSFLCQIAHSQSLTVSGSQQLGFTWCFFISYGTTILGMLGYSWANNPT